jgi:hypothetical protein
VGTVLASKIAGDAADTLFDSAFSVFSTTDHLNFINAGQIACVRLKPDISITNISAQLVEGTKQSISSTGISLVRLVRNMGADGSTPGKSIQFVDIRDLNNHNPSWHSDTSSSTVSVYTYDPNTPRNYYVYPPQPSSNMGYVEKIESVMPTAISTISDTITIDDIYEEPLFHYVLYRAYLIDAKQSNEALQKAGLAYRAFMQAIIGKNATELQLDQGTKNADAD